MVAVVAERTVSDVSVGVGVVKERASGFGASLVRANDKPYSPEDRVGVVSGPSDRLIMSRN